MASIQFQKLSIHFFLAFTEDMGLLKGIHLSITSLHRLTDEESCLGELYMASSKESTRGFLEPFPRGSIEDEHRL